MRAVRESQIDRLNRLYRIEPPKPAAANPQSRAQQRRDQRRQDSRLKRSALMFGGDAQAMRKAEAVMKLMRNPRVWLVLALAACLVLSLLSGLGAIFLQSIPGTVPASLLALSALLGVGNAVLGRLSRHPGMMEMVAGFEAAEQAIEQQQQDRLNRKLHKSRRREGSA